MTHRAYLPHSLVVRWSAAAALVIMQIVSSMAPLCLSHQDFNARNTFLLALSARLTIKLLLSLALLSLYFQVPLLFLCHEASL